MQANVRIDAEGILESVTQILKDLTGDWDLAYSGGIGRDTRLVTDLGFESIDIVQFVVAIEEHFRTRNLPFDQLLMKEGRYVDEIVVTEIVDFLRAHLATR
jgi:acyl carrier protein